MLALTVAVLFGRPSVMVVAVSLTAMPVSLGRPLASEDEVALLFSPERHEIVAVKITSKLNSLVKVRN